MDKHSIKQFKIIVNAFLHIRSIDKSSEDYILKEINRIKNGDLPDMNQLPNPCLGCGGKKSEFVNRIEEVKLNNGKLEDLGDY